MHSKNFLVYVTPFYLATIIPTDHVITSTILLDCYLTLWTFLEHHQIDEHFKYCMIYLGQFLSVL